ncbi:MAG: extracellular solute-binding protein [Lachnospiraceae bacterium]|nr:extracellular solute-binding protein [Lachnospiraceae bacterium]
MLKRTIQRVVAVVLAVMLFMLSGCAAPDKSSEAGTDNTLEEQTSEKPIGSGEWIEIDTELVYDSREISEEIPLDYVYDAAVNGEWLYVYGYTSKHAEDDSTDIWRDVQVVSLHRRKNEVNPVFSYREIETLGGSISYESGRKISVEEMTVTEGGEVLLVTKESENGEEGYYLRWLTPEGTERWSQRVESDSRVNAPVLQGEQVCVPAGNQIFIYDREGVLLRQLTLEEFPEDMDTSNLYPEIEAITVAGDGTVYVSFLGNGFSYRYVLTCDFKTGKMGSWEKTSGVSTAEMIGGDGGKFDFLFKDIDGIYGWNYGDEKKTKLVDFMDSALIREDIYRLHAVSEDSYLMIYPGEDGRPAIYELTKTDPDTAKTRQMIVLGLFSPGDNYVEQIVRFNRNSDRYVIKVADYTKYNDPATQLNLDIAAGNIPDIIYAGSNAKVPFDDYARAGFLEDIKPWFEADSELKPGDFLTNVFDAMGLDGHWYQMATAIEIYSYIGSNAVFADDQSWNLEDYKDLETKNKGVTVLRGIRDDILRDALVFRWEQFVDENNGTCSFDSAEFIELLEWINTFPEELPTFDVNQVRNGKVYAMKTSFSDFSSFNTNLDRLYRQEAEFIGFPGSEDMGGMFKARGISLAMSAKSKCKEGAWEFIRYFFTDEYQIDKLSHVSDQLPVNLNVLEILADKAMNPVFGIWDSYRLNGKEVTVAPPTEEKISTWMDYLKSITRADTVDDEVYNVIVEEAGAYFAGQKSVQDVAKTIQGRVWIYLAEQQ